jgi:DNA-binding FadR family transcriptional regulator
VPSSRRAKSRADEVADKLEAEILRQRTAGAHLGLRTDLIERFGVSAGVVNEALRLLRERDLVTVKPGPNGGVFVADLPPGVRLYELDLWFQGLSIEPLKVFESRVLLDDLFTDLAIDRATTADLLEIEMALQAMESAAEDARKLFEGILAFHAAIARASHVEVLAGLYETLTTALLVSLVRARFREGREEAVQQSVRAHRELFEALRARDRGRLSKAVSEHRGGLISPLEPERSPLLRADDRPDRIR